MNIGFLHSRVGSMPQVVKPAQRHPGFLRSRVQLSTPHIPGIEKLTLLGMKNPFVAAQFA
jgi:hypothetical protein